MARDDIRFGKPGLRHWSNADGTDAADLPPFDGVDGALAIPADGTGSAGADLVAAGQLGGTIPPTLVFAENEIEYISGVGPAGAPAARSYWTDTGTTAQKWGSGTIGTPGGTVTYAFPAASNWSSAEEATLVRCTALWSAVANIQFVRVDPSQSPEVTFVRGTDKKANTTPQFATAASGNTLATLASAVVSIDTNSFVDLSGAANYGLSSAVHELGHVLGLGHGGNYNQLYDAKGNPLKIDPQSQFSEYDSRLWSTMSYFQPNDATAKYFSSYPVKNTDWSGVQQSITWMPLDIVAAQRLYGPAVGGPLSGGQVFGFNSNLDPFIKPFFDFSTNDFPVVTLYDTGTNNTLDLSGYLSPATIDLRQGRFSSFQGMTNNLAIAFGTRIDTAIGGGGNDSITGNGDANYLVGGHGADTFDGGPGHDWAGYLHATEAVAADLALFGTAGEAQGDTYISIENLDGSNFNDTLWGGFDSNFISGEDGADSIVGRSGDDTLGGSAGNDTLVGDAGADFLLGGAGTDYAGYADASAFVAVDLALPALNLGDAAGDTYSSIEGIFGSAFGDHLAGDSHNNIIHGNGAADFIGGGGGNDWLYGDDGNDTLQGDSGVDFLYGGTGDDVLDGGAGPDLLNGGLGDDTYYVDTNSDRVQEAAGQGHDTVITTASFSLSPSAEVELLRTSDDGGTDPIDLTGSNTPNLIIGNAGSNLINGRGGADTMQGLAGSDYYTVDDPGDQVIETPDGGYDYVTATVDYTMDPNVENLTLTGSAITGNGNATADFMIGSALGNVMNGGDGADSIYGRIGADTLHGGTGDDTLNGGADNDLLYGDAGNDTLTGAGGQDTMAGGSGNDLYNVDDPGDVVTENPGEGTDRVISSASFALGDNVENLTLTGSDTLSGTGNALANRIAGNDGNNTLSGGAGNDTLTGGLGDDYLDGGTGRDSLDGGAGDDAFVVDSLATVIGGDGHDIVQAAAFTAAAGFHFIAGAGSGIEVIQGQIGNDTIDATLASTAVTVSSFQGDDVVLLGAGDDGVFAGDGNDSVNGGQGFDQIEGGDGNDTLIGGGGPVNPPWGDWLFGGAGDDVLVGSGYGWVLGDDGNDTLTGGVDDLVRGDAGNDSITGTAGFQQIIGADGDDTMAGGADGDRFDFADGWGHDQITDFQIGSDLIYMADVTGLDTFSQLSVGAAPGGAQLAFGGNTILLLGIAPGDVTPAMFVL